MSEEKKAGAAVDMVTLREAADRLNVSVDTVRRMLKRGELTGEQRKTKQGMTWFVVVPAEAAPSSEAAPLAAAERDELIVLRERSANLERIVEVSQREAEHARQERDEWKARAEAADEAQHELRVILAKALPGRAPLELATGEEAPIAATGKTARLGLLERARRRVFGA